MRTRTKTLDNIPWHSCLYTIDPFLNSLSKFLALHPEGGALLGGWGLGGGGGAAVGMGPAVPPNDRLTAFIRGYLMKHNNSF